MQAKILTQKEYEGVLAKLDLLKQLTNENQRKVYLDNLQLQAFLGISKRTAKEFREQGSLPFFQMGRKFYYAIADIEAMMLCLKVTLNPYVAPSNECRES